MEFILAIAQIYLSGHEKEIDHENIQEEVIHLCNLKIILFISLHLIFNNSSVR